MFRSFPESTNLNNGYDLGLIQHFLNYLTVDRTFVSVFTEAEINDLCAFLISDEEDCPNQILINKFFTFFLSFNDSLFSSVVFGSFYSFFHQNIESLPEGDFSVKKSFLKEVFKKQNFSCFIYIYNLWIRWRHIITEHIFRLFSSPNVDVQEREGYTIVEVYKNSEILTINGASTEIQFKLRFQSGSESDADSDSSDSNDNQSILDGIVQEVSEFFSREFCTEFMSIIQKYYEVDNAELENQASTVLSGEVASALSFLYDQIERIVVFLLNHLEENKEQEINWEDSLNLRERLRVKVTNSDTREYELVYLYDSLEVSLIFLNGVMGDHIHKRCPYFLRQSFRLQT